MAAERLQKILARGGLASRRAAEALVTEGRVRVNGKIVTELGTKADPRKDKVEVDGKRVVAESPVYFALHKPRGFVTTMNDPEGRPTIRDLIRPHGIAARVFPVGRLDFATSGILLLTNDGAFSDGLLHPKRAVPKTYVVKVHGVMEPTDLDVWRHGVQLEDGKTLPAEAFFLRHEEGKTWFQITIREGRNQQIRRMGEATGFRVMRLSRTSFAGITSEDLKPGDLRPLGYEELVQLKKDFGVPRRPGVARGPVEGYNPRPRAGVEARRMAQRIESGEERREGRSAPGHRERSPREGGERGRLRADQAPREGRRGRSVRESGSRSFPEGRGPKSSFGDVPRPPSSPFDRRGGKSSPADRSGGKSAPTDRRGPKSAPTDRRGPKSAPEERRGPKSAPTDRRGPKSAPEERRGPKSAPTDRRGPKSAPTDRRGPKSAPTDRRGPKSAPTDRRASPRPFAPRDRELPGEGEGPRRTRRPPKRR
jgi:23S rRNA pseudouridine2605 synthase